MVALMSIALVLVAVVAIGSITVGATNCDPLGHSWIPYEGVCSVCNASILPEFEFVDHVASTLDEIDFPHSEIKSNFSKEAEVKYENGKYMIKDVGASEAVFYNNTDYIFIPMTLEDGYWTVELSEEVYNGENVSLYVNFKGDMWQLTYTDGIVNGSLQISAEGNTYSALIYYYSNNLVEFLYPLSDRCYRDTYTNGVLSSQIAEISTDEYSIKVYYESDGAVSRISVYKYMESRYYYYSQEDGWSTSGSPCDAPVGFENANLDYFLAVAPFTVNCTHEEYAEADCETPEKCKLCGIAKEGGEALGHEMLGATCTEPSTCKNGCGHTEGHALTHSWVDSETLGKKECSVCGEILLPDFDFVTFPYPTLAETGFDTKGMLNVFPSNVETKYENGKYMIKDIGAFSAEYYDTYDYSRAPMTLEDGYWTVEISEDIYNDVIDMGEDFCVNFFGEDRFWDISYSNGLRDYVLQIATPGNVYVALIRANSDCVEFSYPLYDRYYSNSYMGGVLSGQKVALFFEDNSYLFAYYLADGTLDYVTVYDTSEHASFYYFPDFGWTRGSTAPNAACDAPAGYEDADTEFFTSLAPTSINCQHEEYLEADCLNPEYCAVCGLVKDGSVALGHNMADATCTEPSTCKNGCGHTEGDALGHDMADATCTEPSTCIYCEHTEGKALGHDMADATCTEPSTCIYCEHTEGEALGHDMADATCTKPATCKNGCGHTEGEVLDHDMADATCTDPATCTDCGHTEGDALDHDMADATCTDPATCIDCGHAEGDALGHDWRDATTESPKTCSACGETDGEPLPEENKPAAGEDNKNETPDGSLQGGTDEENSDGCGSIIGLGSIALATALGAAFVISKKRKE